MSNIQQNPQGKKTQKQIVSEYVLPWVYVAMVFFSFIAALNLLYARYAESKDSDEVKLSREETARELFKAEQEKAKAEGKKYEYRDRPVVVQYNPFPR